MKWSHDYKRDISHPNETQIRTCTCLHDDVRCKNINGVVISNTNKIHNEKFNYIKFWCDLNIIRFYKNRMHSFEVSLGYESVDRTTFST